MRHLTLVASMLICHRQQAIKSYFKHKSGPESTQNASGGNGNNGTPLEQGLLAPKHWRSQQQSTSVTGKYLGPMCEAIPRPTGLETYSEDSNLDTLHDADISGYRGEAGQHSLVCKNTHIWRFTRRRL